MFEDVGFKHLLSENVEELVLNDYARLYKENLAAHFVIRIDGYIASMAGAFIKSDMPFCYFKTPTYGFIGYVYTLPQHRRQGLASKLSKGALDWLRGKGISSVRLLA